FLPFVFLFYCRLLRSTSLYATCLFSFFLWLLFATAYPGEFIITSYLLAAMLLVKIARAPKDTRIRFVKKMAGLHVVAILLFSCLALPAILSFAQFLPLSERGAGASYEDAMSNPLHPALVVAYILPLGIFDTTKFIITDPLERNSWFGLFTFIFFVAALLIKSKNKWVTYLKYAFFISFIFSLGEWGLLRIVAYYTLPLMNTFRHPALFKLYSIFFGVLLAAFYLQALVQQTGTEKKYHQVFRILIIIIAGLGIFALINSENIYQAILPVFKNKANIHTVAVQLKAFRNSLSFYNLLLISIIIQFPFLIFFYRFAIKKFDLKKIVWAGTVNCMAHAAIFTFFTIVKKDSAQGIQAVIDTHTRKDYPIPSLTSSLQQNSEDGMKYFKEIGTLNMYNKKIGRVDYFISPPNLITQNKFWNNTGLRNRVMQYPLAYQPDTACNLNDTAAQHSITTKKIVFVTDSNYINQINHNAGNSIDLSFSQFTPNSFHFTCNAKGNTFLVLSQNRYPFWQATIDGKKNSIIPVNGSFMGVAIPAGKHSLHFDFKANHLVVAFIISLVTMFLLLIFLAFKKKQSGSVSK
ncbi:MAG TPA: YfhO family protein, partial [Niastella sp.]